MRWPAAVATGALVVWLAPGAPAQNSGRIERPEPSATAARAGSAVAWRADLDAARAEAEGSSRPVFWYVPAVERSPMDRKAEIDRYMMAGPFSDPDVIALLNAGFVPVRQRAAGAVARAHGLAPGKFIEPGFVVLAPDGAETLRADRITTLHPAWFLALLRPVAAAPATARERPEVLAHAWEAYAAGDAKRAEALLAKTDSLWPAPMLAEAGFLRGAVLHRTGRADRAVEVWTEAARAHPDQPYGWKAAAEAEGHGPFATGFEDFLALPEAILRAPGSSTRAPDGAYGEQQLEALGARFLLRMQQPDGGYTDSKYDFGGTDSLPNVHMAITAIAGAALLEHRDPDAPGVAAALARIVQRVCDDDHLAAADTDEIVWAHIYRVLLFARWLELRPDDAPRVRPALVRSARALQELRAGEGAWFHEYPNPFATASALIALHAAQGAGVEIDADRIAAGVRALLACRAASGAFSYGQVTSGEPRASIAAAAGRMPLCELALGLWRERDPADLERALRAAFEHHEQLESVRKYDDHANALGYGGFFFWYDMQGRCAALRELRDEPLRRELAAKQRALILSIPELDGCFVDSHELGRVYGTAMALWCLAALRSM